MNNTTNSIVESLNKLGLRVSPRQIAGFVAAILTGVVVARLLPYFYPIVASRWLDIFFGLFERILGTSLRNSRDSMNTFLMTACTFTSSFLVAFVSALLFRTRRRSG